MTGRNTQTTGLRTRVNITEGASGKFNASIQQNKRSAFLGFTLGLEICSDTVDT